MLYLAMSPDGEMIVTDAGDETVSSGMCFHGVKVVGEWEEASWIEES